jgi:hypothetical protein
VVEQGRHGGIGVEGGDPVETGGDGGVDVQDAIGLAVGEQALAVAEAKSIPWPTTTTPAAGWQVSASSRSISTNDTPE